MVQPRFIMHALTESPSDLVATHQRCGAENGGHSKQFSTCAVVCWFLTCAGGFVLVIELS
jgi:hypothetical protein